jgi:ferredoxin/flavodoxin---NADP+ reductase
MSIPGEDLPDSFPAISFVGWYNGHPDYRELSVDLSCERAVVVGNGNVAMDVARMLVTSTDALRQTDMAGYALEALERSSVREVVVLGRRGAAQASFTTPELRGRGSTWPAGPSAAPPAGSATTSPTPPPPSRPWWPTFPP